VLIEFGSVVGAVECALALQRLAVERNAGIPGERRMEWRVGIHLATYWSRATTSSATASTSRHGSKASLSPAHLHLRGCFSPSTRQGRGRVRRHRRAEPQEHRPAAARLPCRPGLGVRAVNSFGNGLAAPGQAIDRGAPFANMSGDPEQEYFVDGMVEEIITALSQIRWLFVIARNSTLPYKSVPST